MKISGFTIIKNAIINSYPIVEAINSILPVVDEMIVLIGDCEDATEDLINRIQSPKIKIHHSVWDKTLRTGGTVLAVETNKAFNLIDPESTWAFYIQADEAIHEQDFTTIKAACLKYKDNQKVQGLLFKYLHFYGTYDYVGDSRKWYNREVRIIRNNKNVQSYKDAQGFRINGKHKILVKAIDATIYHYGWVKSPESLIRKGKNTIKFWKKDEELSDNLFVPNDSLLDGFDSLSLFKGTHPEVLHKSINEKNWNYQFDISKKNFTLKTFFLYYFEKATGLRLFDFKNYRIV